MLLQIIFDTEGKGGWQIQICKLVSVGFNPKLFSKKREKVDDSNITLWIALPSHHLFHDTCWATNYDAPSPKPDLGVAAVHGRHIVPAHMQILVGILLIREESTPFPILSSGKYGTHTALEASMSHKLFSIYQALRTHYTLNSTYLGNSSQVTLTAKIWRNFSIEQHESSPSPIS